MKEVAQSSSFSHEVAEGLTVVGELVVLQKCHSEAVGGCHQDNSHLGLEKVRHILGRLTPLEMDVEDLVVLQKCDRISAAGRYRRDNSHLDLEFWVLESLGLQKMIVFAVLQKWTSAEPLHFQKMSPHLPRLSSLPPHRFSSHLGN